MVDVMIERDSNRELRPNGLNRIGSPKWDRQVRVYMKIVNEMARGDSSCRSEAWGLARQLGRNLDKDISKVYITEADITRDAQSQIEHSHQRIAGNA